MSNTKDQPLFHLISRTPPKISNLQQQSFGNLISQSFDLKFDNGVERTYYRLRPASRTGVAVVVIDNNQILLTREFAGGTQQYEIGLVRGGIDEGEDPKLAALREMREEIGYSAHKITYLRSAISNTAYHDSNTHLYLAEDIYLDPLEGDEPEPIDIIRVPINKIEQIINHPEFRDARNLLALIFVRDLLKQREEKLNSNMFKY